MPNIAPRIARLTAACALTLALGAATAGSASASYNSWAGSAPIDTQAAGEDAGTDAIGRPGGIRSAGEDAGTDGVGKPGGIS